MGIGRLRRWMSLQPWLLGVLLVVGLWLPGVTTGWPRTDSHYYAVIAADAWASAASGSLKHFFALRLGEIDYFNKPPLGFWIHGFVLWVGGFSMLALRLPSLAAAITTVVATGATATHLAGRRAGIATSLVLATTLEFFRQAKSMSLDLWLTCWLSLAVLIVVRSLKRRAYYVLWAAFPLAAALLTKPLVAFVSLALLMIWLLVERRAARAAACLIAGVLAAVLASPWYLWMAAQFPGPGGFIDTHFFEQVVGRAQTGGNTPKPWWYYLEEMVRQHWPWNVTLLAGAGMLLVGRLPARVASAARAGLVLSAGWVLAVSLFGGRASRYLVPAYPAMAILSGVFLSHGLMPMLRTNRGRAARKLLRRIPLVLGPVVLAGGTIGVFLPINHRGVGEMWPSVARWLDALSDDTAVYMTRETYDDGAHLRLLGREYPRVFLGLQQDSSDAAQALSVGDVILTRQKFRESLAPLGEVSFESGDIVVIRISDPKADPARP